MECKELFYRDLPELDDSFADKLLPGCTTLQQVILACDLDTVLDSEFFIELITKICFLARLQVKESLLQKFLEVEQTAREQATDNAILDQLCKVFLCSEILICRLLLAH